MGGRIDYDGLVIAGIGFFLTRFTVTLALYEYPFRFYLAGVLPLMLGLGLAAFGVALAVANVESSTVRTTAVWCVVGSGSMLVLVVLTLLGSTTGDVPAFGTVRSRTYLSNFLIGGSVGGTLTGLYAARTRRQRDELRQQTRRLEVLNRVLRHEVLNAVNVIRGYAAIPDDDDPDAREIIREHAAAIERAIDEVKHLTESAGAGTEATPPAAIDLRRCLDASSDAVREIDPEARIAMESVPEDLTVLATERLDRVFAHLLENAIVHTTGDPPSVAVTVESSENTVRVSVRDDGPGLPERQRALLEAGEIQEFDDPDTGFGLNVVRLLVESYGGRIETDVDDGTTITVILRRAAPRNTGFGPDPSRLTGVRPSIPHLLVTFGAALIAGVAYGIASELLGGSIAGIGVFYGTASPVVGWLTHEFHSVVFGFVFAGLISLAPPRYRNDVPAQVLIGVAWGIALWIVAAGIIAPLWLRVLAIPAPIPNLSFQLLVTHLVWGVSLGALTGWGYEHVAPWLARRSERLRRSSAHT
jgi:signal transduction histidine kinase